MRDQPARHQQGRSRRGDQRSRADHEPAAAVQPRVHVLAERYDAESGKRGSSSAGGDGRSLHFDVALLLATTQRVPRNLPIIAAKGGPGGEPGAGRHPMLRKTSWCAISITNTGWGTGLDIRPNPGIGHPCCANYFPATRADRAAQHPTCLPGPAIGPVAYPGAPPYGAPLYGPGGVPLWPGLAPAGPGPGPAHPTQRRPNATSWTGVLSLIADEPQKQGFSLADLRGNIWRLGIFLAVCLFGTFELLTLWAVSFRKGK